MDELTPITRREKFLAAAGGQSVTLPEPLTREELYLAKAAGEDVTTPDPITRKEMYLDAIAEGGGGGGGGGGGTDLASLEVYVADFATDPPTVTDGAYDGWRRSIIS